MSVIKMYVSAAASAAASVAIDVPLDGRLEAVSLGVQPADDPAAGDNVVAEVSFSSASQFTTHDSRASLCQVNAEVLTLATGHLAFYPSTPLCFQNGIDVPVSAGERIYLHIDNTGNAASAIAYLFIRDGADQPSRGRRRTR